MIEGLKLRVTSKELKEHCLARAAYHVSRAQTKEKELPKLRETVAALSTPGAPASLAKMSKGGYNLNPQDAVEALEQDVRDHQNKSLVFTFFAEHLFEEDYTLKEDDLVRLELLKR